MHRFNKLGMSCFKRTIGVTIAITKEVFKVPRLVILHQLIRVDQETIYKIIPIQRRKNRNWVQHYLRTYSLISLLNSYRALIIMSSLHSCTLMHNKRQIMTDPPARSKLEMKIAIRVYLERRTIGAILNVH
jgi:hypothetical protein